MCSDVDALYRPNSIMRMWMGDRSLIEMDVSNEPWTKMPTKDFLPCFDKYGQFKYREWPGKTHSDEELKAAGAAEEKDLAAHPGPKGWDRFGGWADGPKQEATGRFRTAKVDGKWWLVDPEGNLFWSWGAVRVTPSSAMTPLNGNSRTPQCGGAMPDRDCLFEGLPKKDEVPEAELKAFTRVICEEYFKRTRDALREFDKGLLYLGCRFAGVSRPWAMDACAKYADVVSYNIYLDEVLDWRLPDGLDAPVMVGEFHFGAHDRGLFGAGLINKHSQEGRAAALKAYVESALRNPQMVGAHWHQFSDQATSGRFNGEHFQVGWTDICDRPYVETIAALRSIDIYATRTASPICGMTGGK